MTEQQVISSAFFDEMQKLAWFGTYYHGAPAETEAKILREGLKASMGGKGRGAVTQLGEFARQKGGQEGKLLEHMAESFKVKGRVSMAKSKNLARIYGTVLDSARREEILNNFAKIYETAIKPPAEAGTLLGRV